LDIFGSTLPSVIVRVAQLRADFFSISGKRILIRIKIGITAKQFRKTATSTYWSEVGRAVIVLPILQAGCDHDFYNAT